MSDLISRSALIKDFEDLEAIALEQVNKYNPVYSRDEWRWWSAVLKERTAYKQDLMNAPTVDAVEVVRCRDCKHSDMFDGNTECDFPLKCLGIRYGGVYENWYCEHGERREDAAD